MSSSGPGTPDTSMEIHDTSNRRKSGRARTKPVLLSQDLNVVQSSRTDSAKRKRPEAQDLGGGDEGEEDDEQSEESESDADEEELKERRKKAARARAAKPLSKKPKTGTSNTTNLPVRLAVNGVKKASRAQKTASRKIPNATGDSDDLFAAVFSSDDLDEVAAGWLRHWERHQSKAMCALINFIIRCTGCSSLVDVHDIDDPDNVVSKLTDLQDEYQAQKPADYPLVSKTKTNASFRGTMIDFIETLIAACHAQGLLYSDLSIMENVEIWVSTMSSSSIRPFRHTATVISLTMGSSICKLAADLSESIARISRQQDGEKKKKRVNDARVKDLQKSVAEVDRKLTQNKEFLQTMFETVFVHRYRDVDPRIRQECVTAIGNWILTFPDYFFEGSYLRYLGWVLSDSSAPVRAEVIKQLLKLYKNRDNIARLRTFTDRFRPRIIEMAMQDADLNIRISAIELLELIRETELLEPDDIDNIGRLIFDSEPRVRKAVAGFFSENINDLYESTLDEFGGAEGLAETLGDEIEDDYDSPRASWLKLKCMAECLRSYDAGEGSTLLKQLDTASGGGFKNDTRLSLAAQNIHDVVPEVRDWEVLAGYLLHDFSRQGKAAGASDRAFEERCKLDENEDMILLELINVAVKSQLHEAVEGEPEKKGRRTAKQKDESHKAQETMAVRLAQTIPKLLKKFGSNALTASAILALGSIMSFDIFQELRQESTTYASLLDDINRQFLLHSNQEVLTEATNALLHAQEYEDLNEVTESKIQELWEDTIKDLRMCLTANLSDNLTALSDTVRRISSLTNVISCVSVFESEARANPRKKTSKTLTATPLELLVNLIRDPALDQEAGEDAVEILTHSMRAVRCYYMWVTVARQDDVDTKRSVSSLPDFAAFVDALTAVAKHWPPLSQVRQVACSCVLDVHTLYARFRHAPSASSESPLVIPHIPREPRPLIIQTFIALEKQYARLARKKLEDESSASDFDAMAPPASDAEDNEDQEPHDSSSDEDEAEDSDSEDQDNGKGTEQAAAEKRKMRVLLAEQNLCRFTYSIMLSIIGMVLDCDPQDHPGRIRQRIQRNRTKLGGSFKETLAQTDDTPAVSSRAGARKTKAPNAQAEKRDDTNVKQSTAASSKPDGGKRSKGGIKSAALVEDEDDEDEDDEQEENGDIDGGAEEEEEENRDLSGDRIEDPDGDEGGGGSKVAAVENDDEIMGD